MAGYLDLVERFHAAYPEGEGDAMAFAEWLCDDQQYFGSPAALEAAGETDMAWTQALDWYGQRNVKRAGGAR